MGIVFLLLLGIAAIKVLRLLGAYARRQRERQEAAVYEAECRREAEEQASMEDAFRRFSAKAAAPINPDLQCLGLDSMPKDYPSLKNAWKKAMFRAHPDRGGDADLAVKINNAFARLRQGVVA